MRKSDTRQLRIEFVASIGRVENSINDVSGTTVSRSTKKLIAESSFFTAVVLWDSFVSELFFGLVNRGSTVFAASQQSRVREYVQKKFGGDLAAAMRLDLPTHISVERVRRLIDQQDRNVSFACASEMVARAADWLHPAFAVHFASLAVTDMAIIDTSRAIRNFLAHRSGGSGKALGAALANASLPDSFRRRNNTVRDVGKYLLAIPPGQSQVRVAMLLDALRRLALKIQP